MVINMSEAQVRTVEHMREVLSDTQANDKTSASLGRQTALLV